MARVGARQTVGAGGREAASGEDAAIGGRFLPAALSRYLRRRGEEIVGILLMAVGAALAVILVGFDVADPSLNTATGLLGSSDGVANPLGYPGAVIADLLLQSVGLVAGVLALVPTVWGWRIMRHDPVRAVSLRLAALPIALCLICLGLSAAPVPEMWPLRAGLGGFVGSLLLNPIVPLLPAVQPVEAVTIVGLLSGLLGGFAVAWILGLRARDAGIALSSTIVGLSAVARGGLRLGRVGGSVGGRMGRVIGGGLKSTAGRALRREPLFGGSGTGPEPDDNDDFEAEHVTTARPIPIEPVPDSSIEPMATGRVEVPKRKPAKVPARPDHAGPRSDAARRRRL